MEHLFRIVDDGETQHHIGAKLNSGSRAQFGDAYAAARNKRTVLGCKIFDEVPTICAFEDTRMATTNAAVFEPNVCFGPTAYDLFHALDREDLPCRNAREKRQRNAIGRWHKGHGNVRVGGAIARWVFGRPAFFGRLRSAGRRVPRGKSGGTFGALVHRDRTRLWPEEGLIDGRHSGSVADRTEKKGRACIFSQFMECTPDESVRREHAGSAQDDVCPKLAANGVGCNLLERRRMGLLEGKVAIVTGAGSGLGRAYARLFAKEGARVVVNDLGTHRSGEGRDPGVAEKVAREIVQRGGVAVASSHSVAAAETASSVVELAVRSFGRVDILVNSAGILQDKTFLKMDEASLDASIGVHLKGTFFMGQAFAKQALTQGTGEHVRIVNTTAVSGMVGNFGQANYAAASAAVYGLTRTMSIELQKHRIVVNCLAPIAKTRLTEDLPMFQGVETMTVEHVAPAALFLASHLASDRTGHVLAVAGARMYAFKIVESAGRFKDDQAGIWTAHEIAEHWDAIAKV